MLKLNAGEVTKVVEKTLKSLYPEFNISEVRTLVPSLKKMFYNKERSSWSLDSVNSKSVVMAYHNGFNDTPLTLEQVKYFIKKEYTEAKNVVIEFVETTFEKEKSQEFVMEIHFDDESNLTRENIEDLIDMALSTNDKEWFNDLLKRYDKILKGV